MTSAAMDAKCNFCRLISLARAELVAEVKHGLPVVGNASVEMFER